MKRNMTIILAGAALLALAACSREPLAEEPGTEVLSAVIIDEAPTRTSYDGTTGKFAWTENDHIVLFLKKKDASLYKKEEVRVVPNPLNTSTGTVPYTAFDSYDRSGYAVYPATGAKSWDGSTLTVTLPASYDAAAAVQLPLVAENSNAITNLTFLPACGLLRIKCKGLTANTVTVTLGKGITGDFAVGDPGTTPTITAADATAENTTVTFTVSGTEATLDLPLPCGDYASVSVTCDGTTKTVSVPFTIARGMGKKLLVTF